jgi:ATP-dependent helicase/nuclease subunit A
MKYTPDQARAIGIRDRNLIVIAGAGSGKTRVLVERYLALLDANPDWPLNALVAITFTKKAAEEMRDRVRQGLESRLYAASEPTEIDRWTALFSQIDSARIDTIHGLCADLLRANAAEARLDPDFEVLDEVDAAILLEDTIDTVLMALAAFDDPALELLTEYDSRTLRQTLTDEALLLAPLKQHSPEELLDYWRAMWEEEAVRRFDDFCRWLDGAKICEQKGDDLFAQRWRECRQAIARIQRDSDVVERLGACGNIAALSMRGGSAKVWGGKDALDEAKTALSTIRGYAREVLKAVGDPPGEDEERAAHLTPLWVSLIGRVSAAYRQAKAEQSLLDFNDLEQITSDLLRHDSVQARYRDAEFRHLLVDEFQDTNDTQWQIIQRLAGTDRQGSMFVVGDQKQSIYAFRGADVSVFGQVRDQIVAAGGKEIPLAISFRTHQPLVTCFNELFARLLVRDPHSPVAAYQVERGEEMEAHRTTPPQNSPPLELLLIDRYQYDDEGQPIPDEQGKVKALSADDRRRWEALEIAQRLRAMVESGALVYDKETGENRPVDYGDMAILFRSLRQVTLYEEVFKVVGLPFVTVAGRGYYDRQEVWDLLNLLRALYNPADDLSLAVALRSPLFGLSDDALLALRLPDDGSPSPPGSLWEALTNRGQSLSPVERERAAYARACLDELRAVAGRVTISELLRSALERTGYLAVLSGLPDGPRRRGNVEKLLEIAQTSGKVTLGAFSQYLRDMSEREVRESEAVVDVSGAVSIMTVHASKGLEFPVIVLADASWERGSGQRDAVIWDEGLGLGCKVYADSGDLVMPFGYRQVAQRQELRDEAERLRLLYVAATRAGDYLLVSGRAQQDRDQTGWKSSGWLDLLLDALELRHEVQPAEERLLDRPWGQARIHALGRWPQEQISASGDAGEQSGWQIRTPAVDPTAPPLLAPVASPPETRARHLSATHIADLGGMKRAGDPLEQRQHRERFRRMVLQDAPDFVEEIRSAGEKRITRRQIGEIVHLALQHWQLPDQPDLHELLYSYAWRQGITDHISCYEAARQANRLLVTFKNSDMYRLIDNARQVYRELPFIYERDGYIIHGIIDVLLQTAGGEWVIVDYKTGRVPPPVDDETLRQDARRYHLQVGVYADAVREQLGENARRVYIHYVRYNRQVHIHEDEWRDALAETLTAHILEVIGEQTS